MAALGCAARDPTPDRRWSILTAPASHDYPLGDPSAALSDWRRMSDYEFDSFTECTAAEKGVQNPLERPIECVATDDPRFRQ